VLGHPHVQAFAGRRESNKSRMQSTRTPARRAPTLTPATGSRVRATPRATLVPPYGSPVASPSTPTPTVPAPAPFLTPMGAPTISKSGSLTSRKTPLTSRSHTPRSAQPMRKRQRARKILKETDRHRVEAISSLPASVMESTRTIVGTYLIIILSQILKSCLQSLKH